MVLSRKSILGTSLDSRLTRNDGTWRAILDSLAYLTIHETRGRLDYRKATCFHAKTKGVMKRSKRHKEARRGTKGAVYEYDGEADAGAKCRYWLYRGMPHGPRHSGGMAAGSASIVSGPVTNPCASNKMDLKEWKWADPGNVRRFDSLYFLFFFDFLMISQRSGGFESVYE